MKKLFLFITLLFFVTSAFGQSTIIVAKKKSASCNPANDELGNRALTVSGTNGTLTMPADRMYCQKFAAECSGTLGYGYSLHAGAGYVENLKMCVFNDNGTGDEPEDATAVGSCGTITTDTDDDMVVKKTDVKLTGSVVATTSYWICIVTDASIYLQRWSTSSGSHYYNSISGSYTTPTTNAGDAWTELDRDLAIYVEIE